MLREKRRLMSTGLILFLVTTLACGQSGLSSATPPEPILEPGDSTHYLNFDGMERSYLLHIPPEIDPSQPTAVVIIFHGFNLNAEDMVRITGFSDRADEEGFVAVYPNGTGNKPSWNGGDCCGEAVLNQVDDVGFVSALIKDLSRIFEVDHKRVYATGFSNGAIMAYRLACEISDQIAAVAPVSATQAVEDCQPERPVSIQHFHGTADQLNPYEGGYGPGGGVYFASVADTIHFWAEENNCPSEAQTSQSGSIVFDIYSPCDQGAEVELYTIVGGEHAWPGGESVGPGIGTPTTEISATALMWKFFMDHPMP